MTWLRMFCAVLLMGCTITVKPFEVQPDPGIHHKKSHYRKAVQPSETPQPSPSVTPRKQPLNLHPRDTPTPTIKITPSVGSHTFGFLEGIT